jgi:hypothetical protein
MKFMEIFIDQSGRLEFTSVDTVIAYATNHGTSKTILIKAKEKRILQELFRKADKPLMFTYKSFVILIYLLLKGELDKINSISIDMEYDGQQDLIKSLLLQLLRKSGIYFRTEQINFIHVGKDHLCHDRAIRTYRREYEPDLVVTANDVFREIL